MTAIRPSLNGLYVLIAVNNRQLHAYGIYQDVRLLSEYDVLPSRATIKRILDRYVAYGWLEADTFEAPVRYLLTELGRKHARNHVRTLEQAVRIAKTNLLLQ